MDTAIGILSLFFIIIFWGTLIYGIWAINFQENKEKKKIGQGVLNIAAFIFIIIIIGSVFEKGSNFFGWAGDKMDSRDSRKERCVQETYNIKNEFTAKKMYKACMKR